MNEAVKRSGGETLLAISDVERIFGGARTLFGGRTPAVHAVQGLSLDVRKGETLGIVGESGCGKSTLARLVVGLDLPTSGSITFGGEDLTELARRDRRALARKVQYVFQDPVASLNPRKKIRTILEAPLIHLLKMNKAERAKRLEELMDAVKEIHEGNSVGRSHIPHRGRIEGNIGILGNTIGNPVGGGQVLQRHRRDKGHLGITHPVILLCPGVLEKGLKLPLETLQARWAIKRGIESEEGNDGIRLQPGKPLVRGFKMSSRAGVFLKSLGYQLLGPRKGELPIVITAGMGPESRRVSFIAQVADHDLRLGKSQVELGLEVAEVIHARAQARPDQSDTVALLHLQPLDPRGGGTLSESRCWQKNGEEKLSGNEASSGHHCTKLRVRENLNRFIAPARSLRGQSPAVNK